jgi:DNA mismatch repair protein MutS2
MDARRLVEEALGAARAAGDEAAAREARRMVEQGIRLQSEGSAEGGRADGRTGGQEAEALAADARVRLPSGGTGKVLELRSDGTAVVTVGGMKIVLDRSALTPVPADSSNSGEAKPPVRPSARPPLRPESAPALEVDLRGLTGDEAEQATIAAVDAAVLAEQPFLRIIHGMGTGVVRERVRRVVSADRRITRFGFAPRNQGGTGVTIVEFSA